MRSKLAWAFDAIFVPCMFFSLHYVASLSGLYSELSGIYSYLWPSKVSLPPKNVILHGDFYPALDPTTREIRLLQLFPERNETATLSCKLATVSLDDQPSYLALSHTWGDSRLTENIAINGIIFPVTPNVKSALTQWNHHLRYNGLRNYSEFHNIPLQMPHYFWIDAICIDQQDERERGSQIRLMDQIYGQAFATIAWLGPSSEERDAAYRTFAKINGIVNEATGLTDLPRSPEELFTRRSRDTSGCAQVVDQDHRLSLGLNTSFDIPILPLIEVFRNKWWQRVWTWQEVALARKVLVSWGPNVIQRKDMKCLHRVIKYKERLTGVAYKSQELQHEIWRLLGSLGTLAKQLESIRPEGDRLTLLDALMLARISGRKCSDARDHYFGVLGMIDHSRDEMQHLGDVEYGDGMVVIWTRVTQALIKTYGLDVLALCYSSTSVPREIDGRRRTVFYGRDLSELPSWVMDLRTPLFKGIQAPLSDWRENLFNASRWLTRTEAKNPVFNGSTLLLDGISIDRVTNETARLSDGVPAISDEEWLAEHLRPWIRKAIVLLKGSSVYGDVDDQHSKALAVYRTVIADHQEPKWWKKSSRHNRRLSHAIDSVAFQEVPAYMLSNEENAMLSGRSMYLIDEFRDGRLSTYWHLFVTEKGYVGLARLGVLPGDVVCLFHNSSTPYVLHPLDSEANETTQRYRLVGNAYVHGMMDGEYKPSTSEYRTFNLV